MYFTTSQIDLPGRLLEIFVWSAVLVEIIFFETLFAFIVFHDALKSLF
jgi:hypothetical protein